MEYVELNRYSSTAILRCIYLDSGANAEKYDVEHDVGFTMRDREDDLGFEDSVEVTKDEFEAVWANVEYES